MKAMKVLQKILLTFAMAVGLSLAVSAQKPDEPKKIPPKQPPPVIIPAQPKPPKNDEKPKKPSFAFVVAKSRESAEST
jgi:hypothetical protein